MTVQDALGLVAGQRLGVLATLRRGALRTEVLVSDPMHATRLALAG